MSTKQVGTAGSPGPKGDTGATGATGPAGAGGGTVIRLDAQFDNTTTLLNAITGFSQAMTAGSEWRFRALLVCSLDAIGLAQVSVDTPDTLTVTSMHAQVYWMRSSSATGMSGQNVTALAAATPVASSLNNICTIEGSLKVNAAGTFVIKFGQSAGPNGTSSVLVDSYVQFNQVS